MKKAFVILLVFSGFLVSCSRQKVSTIPFHPDYLMFGLTGGLAGASHYYYLANERLYYINPLLMGPMMHLDSVLPKEDYVRATALLYNFPDYLKYKPDSTYGSSCCDMEYVHLEYRQSGKTYSCNINAMPDGLPVELKGYPAYVLSVINSLK